MLTTRLKRIDSFYLPVFEPVTTLPIKKIHDDTNYF